MGYERYKYKVGSNIMYTIVAEGESNTMDKAIKVGNNRVRHGHYNSYMVWYDNEKDEVMGYYPN